MGYVSTLNPNAPDFIPMAYYDAVEDFSDQWWNLVQSSPNFRDYWLQECFQDPDLSPQDDDDDGLLFPDIDSIFDHCLNKQEEEAEKERRRETDLISLGKLMWGRDNKARVKVEVPKRYCEKPPKIVSVKVSPRTINQPR